MKLRITTLIATLALPLIICAVAQASVLYTVNGTDFGNIDTTTGAYNSLAAAPYAINLVNNGTGFYTMTSVEGSDKLWNIDTSGTITGTGIDTNRAYGLANKASNSTQLYAYDYNSDNLGTIDAVTGVFTGIGSTGIVSSSPVGGRLAFMGDTLYGSLSDGNGYFGTLDTGTGSLSTIRTDGSFAAMVIASDGTNLYGLTASTLYKINTADGTLSNAVGITGYGGSDFTGAAFGSTAVPEPSTYALLCISMGVVGFARKKMTKTAIKA